MATRLHGGRVAVVVAVCAQKCLTVTALSLQGYTVQPCLLVGPCCPTRSSSRITIHDSPHQVHIPTVVFHTNEVKPKERIIRRKKSVIMNHTACILFNFTSTTTRSPPSFHHSPVPPTTTHIPNTLLVLILILILIFFACLNTFRLCIGGVSLRCSNQYRKKHVFSASICQNQKTLRKKREEKWKGKRGIVFKKGVLCGV